MIGSLGPDGSPLALKDLVGRFTTDYYQIRLIRLPILIYHKKHSFEHSRSLHVNLRSRSASCPSPARLSMTWEYWTCHLDYSACYRGRITMRHGARHSAGENFSLTKRKKLETNLLLGLERNRQELKWSRNQKNIMPSVY